MTKPSKGFDYKWQLIIFALALIARFIYLVQAKTLDPLFYHPVMDALYHHEWAISIVKGDWLGHDSFFRAPLYPYFLALVYKLFGINLFVARLIQIVIGALSCVLVERIGTKSFGKNIGILSGLITALYPLFLFFDNELLLPAPLIFLILSGFYLILKQMEKGNSKIGWLLTGIVWGLAAITRPNVLLFLVFLPVWLYWKLRRHAKIALLYGVLGVVLMIAPVTLRNYLAAKEFVPIAWQGGVNFYIGNNPHSDGKTAIVPGTRKSWWGGFNDAKKIAEQALGRKLKNSEMDHYWLNQGLEFIKTEPGKAFMLFLKKTYLFLGGYEISNNRDIYFFIKPTYLKFLIFKIPFFQFPFGLLLPIALIGIWYASRKKKDISLILLLVIAYSFSFIVFFVCERYRLPIIPFLIILASFAVTTLLEHVKNRQYANLRLPAIIFVASFLFFNANLFRIKDNPAINYLLVADVEYQNANYQKAISYLEKALPFYANDFDVLNQLGTNYYQIGRYEQALKYYAKALESDPTQPEPYVNIGNIYYQHRDLEKAKGSYRKALEVNPQYALAYNNLANSYFVQDSLEKALSCYQEAFKIKPDFTNALFYAGIVEKRLGYDSEAESLWRRVLTIEPNHRDALQALRSLVRLQ